MKRHMIKLFLSFFVPAFLACCAQGADPKVIVEDSLQKKLDKNWEWIRENAKAWRQTDKGLEIRVEPGLADTVKNALLRPAPDRSKGKYAIEVTMEFTSSPLINMNRAESPGIRAKSQSSSWSTNSSTRRPISFPVKSRRTQRKCSYA